MSDKQIVKEGIFILGSFIFSTLIFSLATHKQSIYISDIYVGTNHAERNWYEFFLHLNFPAGIIFFFPTLFTVNTVRLLFNKFGMKYLVIFHLFISFVSLIISLIVAGFIKQLAIIFSDSITIYPPLRAIPEAQPDMPHLSFWTYFAYGFCFIHLLMLVLIIIKLSRNCQQL